MERGSSSPELPRNGFTPEEYEAWFTDFEERLFKLDYEQLVFIYQLFEEDDKDRGLDDED